MTTTNVDLQRGLGRMEGTLSSVQDRLDRLETLLDEIKNEISSLKQANSERQGESATVKAFIGFIGGIVALVAEWMITHFGK